MSQKYSFLICGNYGASNLGDEAVLASILRIIRPFSSNITVMSAWPAQTVKLHNINSVWFFPAGFRSALKSIFTGSLFKTLSALRGTDIFILGGGGLFSDEKPMAVIIWFIQALCAKLFKKRMICFGQSVGPLRSLWSRFLTKKAFRWMQIVTVRDTYSKNILEKLNIKDVIALSDPAFLLANSKFPRYKNKRHTQKKQEPYIVVSLRPWSKFLQEKNIYIIAQLIDWISSQYDFKALFVPFQSIAENDTAVLRTLEAHIKNKKVIQLIPFHEDFHKAIKLISGAEIVIGMRLHSIIFAALTHTPFLALSYSQKVRSLVQSLAQEEFLANWNTLNLDDLKKKFTALINQHARIKKILKEKSASAKIKSLEYTKHLRNFLT